MYVFASTLVNRNYRTLQYANIVAIDLISHFRQLLPHTLRKISVFEDFSDDVIHYLRLPVQMATPTWVWQIRREASIRKAWTRPEA